jgi:hypothetical protein
MGATVQERILKVIDKFENGNKSRFAKKIGRGAGNVGDWIHRGRDPDADARVSICKAYNLSRDWLDTGVGTMEPVADPPMLAAPQVSNTEYWKLVGKLEKADEINRMFFNKIHSVLEKCCELNQREIERPEMAHAGHRRLKSDG